MKKNMTKALKNFLVITIPTFIILILLLELFFRVIIPASEIPQSFFDEKELIFRYETNSKSEGLFTIGKAAQQKGRWRINNYGWNSPIDYMSQRENKLIAIFGDSYIEAFQVDTDKSYPSLLRNEMGENFDVYSFGISGAPLSEYLNYSRYANKYFNPDILIFNIVHNDFIESILKLRPEKTNMLTLNIEGDTITENLPKPDYSLRQYNRLEKIIYKSALIRYLYFNLHIGSFIINIRKKNNSEEKYNANIEVSKNLDNKSLIIKSVDYILGKIHEENPNKRIIFIIDAARGDIYRNTLKNSNILFLHDILKENCLKYNFEYIDLSLPMENDYKKNKIKFNSEIDAHWNEYGHNFVYNQIREFLTKQNFYIPEK